MAEGKSKKNPFDFDGQLPEWAPLAIVGVVSLGLIIMTISVFRQSRIIGVVCLVLCILAAIVFVLGVRTGQLPNPIAFLLEKQVQKDGAEDAPEPESDDLAARRAARRARRAARAGESAAEGGVVAPKPLRKAAKKASADRVRGSERRTVSQTMPEIVPTEPAPAAPAAKAPRPARTSAAPSAAAGPEWIDRANAALSAYGSAKGAGDRAGMDAAYDQMREAYEVLQANAGLASDARYNSTVGFTAMELAEWSADGRGDFASAKDYAQSAVEMLQRDLPASEGTSREGAVKASIDLSRVLEGYAAWSLGEYVNVVNGLRNGPYNPTTLGMLAHSMAKVARDRSDDQVAANAMPIFAAMDDMIREEVESGATSSSHMAQRVVAEAGRSYAQMLSHGAEDYPGADITNDPAMAVAVLERCLAYLADPEAFGAEVRADLEALRA